MKVVGIAPAIREDLFEQRPQPHVYLPFGQDYRPNASIHVRLTPGTPAAQADVLSALRGEIRSVDERMPVLAFKTLRTHAEENLELWVVRTGARLFSTFGALALLLAVIGVYALKAYSVARRTREIGIRVAMGATTRDVLWLVIGDGMRLTSVGLGLGILLSLGAARLLSSMLYEVSPTDALIFTVAPALLAAAALAACYIPAHRAARVQPMAALK
jgi:ABC-type antimicrobial peptide transport system permease subunit